MTVEALVRRARRRFAINEALGQLVFAGSVTLGGLALLLTLGTRYLNWWALGPIALAGLAFGFYRVRRLIPSDYAAAVRVDRNAGLQDALSTALHFSRERSEFAAPQRQQAEDAAAGVNLEAAVPFTMPRSLYLMAGLAVLASALVAVRFFSTHGLDLRPPLTEVLFEDSAAGPRAKQKQSGADSAQRKRLETAESLLAKLGVPVNPEDEKRTDALDKAIDQALENPGNAGAKTDKGEGGKAGNPSDQAPAGDPMDDKKSADDQNKAAEGKDGTVGDKSGSKSGGDSPSLMSKLKDAVSNMFSKPSQSDPGQKGQSKQASAGKQEKGAGQKSAGKEQPQGQDQQGSEEGEPNGDAQQGQQAEGKAGARSSQQSSQAGSGVGSQDGAKDLKAAEQLKAMGKISEIIGRRAATVSGETTIEVQSGRQQLRTAYTNKSAAHGETDGGTGRDEIPVAMQSYVQQYFEQVRKAGAAQKGKPEKAVTP
ncbi:MAG: hypothetical protein M3N54_09085 [Acidobacteriota bacterium]|nr:hypothetical protein [Acidobacteriota bacterium]